MHDRLRVFVHSELHSLHSDHCDHLGGSTNEITKSKGAVHIHAQSTKQKQTEHRIVLTVQLEIVEFVGGIQHQFF